MTTKRFGDVFKQLRIQSGQTLRQFCEKNELDPGNISKLERGLLPAPHSEEKLEAYAKALGLKRDSDEWVDFFDLAAGSNKNIGVMQLKNEALLEKMPILFRTLDNKELTEEKLDQIIELIKRA